MPFASSTLVGPGKHPVATDNNRIWLLHFALHPLLPSSVVYPRQHLHFWDCVHYIEPQVCVCLSPMKLLVFIQMAKYIEIINHEDFDELSAVNSLPQFHCLWPLFSKVWCVLATSALVECIFSHSGITIWLHQARMSDELWKMLTCLKRIWKFSFSANCQNRQFCLFSIIISKWIY